MKNMFTPMKSILFLCLFFIINTAYSNDDYWSLVCPPDVTVDCDAELWDLTIYGDAYIHTYGGNQYAGSPTVHYYLNSCGTGYITRTWMAEDPYWNWISCTQTIYVGGGGSFGYHNIEWPDDTTVYGCNPDTHPDTTGKPWWSYADCSMIGVSHKDMVFTVNDGCKKIMRTWTLMDWCGAHNGHYQTWTHRQFIKIINDEVPEFDCPDDITASSANCKNAYVQADPLWVNPSMCGGNFKVTNNSPYSDSKGADISGVYPVGKTKVGITVTFGCGMKKSCWVNVIVKNNKPPSPICLSQLNVALMGIDTNDDNINDQGMIDIWAKDLDWKSFSPCGFEPLSFSFSPDSLEMARTFTCDDLGVNNVKMYVSDRYGNQSYCVVKIDVQNNSANITPCERKNAEEPDTSTHRMSLEGNITNQLDEPVEGIEMSLVNTKSTTQIVTTYDTTVVMVKDSFINFSGAVLYFFEEELTIVEHIDTVETTESKMYSISDANGLFVFDTLLEEGANYMLQCPDINKPLSGIDKNDLDALTDYILGTKSFVTSEEFIAADLNNDGVIDLSDLSLMIDYIKGDITSFGEEDWTIYYNEATFISNPESVLSEKKNWVQFDSITQSIKDLEFKCIQKGDIVDENNIDNNDILADFRDIDDYLNSYAKNSVFAYPNPFDQLINIEINSTSDQEAVVKIFDVSGSLILNGKKQLNKGNNQVQINVDERFGSLIIYQVMIGDQIHSGKLIKMTR